ncbi:transmembrane protein 182 isoform X2 [Hippocampus comes]|uniref:transmembrane protein 182 isoform X2 n=1 Tax=Hippocampus comes TaxID=109280 RepID=UPI00094E9BBA|nr:PREDICTED: transmembrane protein 182 isoform X2 [Hippocampus comes]
MHTLNLAARATPRQETRFTEQNMPSSCCVVGCRNRKNTHRELVFYAIPAGKHPFEKNRRKLWLEAIRRENWTDAAIKNARLCSAHFISGKASQQYGTPDFVPSVFPDRATVSRSRHSKLASENRVKLCARRTAGYNEELCWAKDDKEPQRCERPDAVCETQQPRVVLRTADVGEQHPDPSHQETPPFPIGGEKEEQESPHVKEEEEEEKQGPSYIKEEEQEEDVTKFPCPGIALKTEDEGPSEARGEAEPPSTRKEDVMKFPCPGIALKTEDEGPSEARGEAEPPRTRKEDVTKFPCPGIALKTEDEDEGPTEARGEAEPPSTRKSSHHMTTGADGQSPPDGLLAPLSDNDDAMSHSPHNQDDDNDDDDDDDDDEEFEGHVTRHTDNKRWECSECGKTYAYEGSLKRHMQKHTGEKPCACAVCGKRFSKARILKLHTRTHTGEKPFACTVCGQRFSQKGSLSSHTRIHTGEKPFACSFCGKTFSHKRSLTTRTRTHMGEKPFACSVCAKRFPEKGRLKRHTRTYTRGRSKRKI